MATYPRSQCCVPGCRRWSTRFRLEWLCGDHWRLVGMALKRFRTKRLRPLYRVWEQAKVLRLAFQQRLRDGLEDGGQDSDLWRLVHIEMQAERRWRRSEALIWRRMKRRAIERAAGL